MMSNTSIALESRASTVRNDYRISFQEPSPWVEVQYRAAVVTKINTH